MNAVAAAILLVVPHDPPGEQLSMAWSAVVVLLTLFLLLAVSTGMLWTLLWREAGNRYLAGLGEWCRGGRFKLHARWADAKPPEPLHRFEPGVRVSLAVTGRRCALVKFVVDRPASPLTAPSPATPPAAAGPRRRHVLVWPIDGDWPPLGLRPTNVADALVDLLALPAHLTESTQRFAICTADRKLAQQVFATSLRGLLPADVGLILVGRHLLLDFSDRPFDGVEFTRMIAVAEQLVPHLPPR